MYKFIITGNGFLWHQIRCIMTVLILIGKEKESPDIIKELLDIGKNPRKPQYQMSNHIPLTLFDTEYANVDIKWNVNEYNLVQLIQSLQRQWSFYSVKEVMVKDVIDELSKMGQQTHVTLTADTIFVQKEQGRYKPLLSRMKCASLEEKISHYVKRRKIMKKEESDENEKTTDDCPAGGDVQSG